MPGRNGNCGGHGSGRLRCACGTALSSAHIPPTLRQAPIKRGSMTRLTKSPMRSILSPEEQGSGDQKQPCANQHELDRPVFLDRHDANIGAL